MTEQYPIEPESTLSLHNVAAGAVFVVAVAVGGYWLLRKKQQQHSGGLQILYHDDHYVAIHKPHGMKVHANSSSDPRNEIAMKVLKDQLDGVVVHCAHRIDRPTSGVLVFALDKESCKKLMALFSQKEVEKRYIAVCLSDDYHSRKVGDQFECSEAIPSPKKRHNGKKLDAFTAFTVLAVGKTFTIVECMPTTGRHHQIRVHLAALRLPIFGDYLHGNVEENNRLGASRMFLSAAQLSFIHPYTKNRVCINSSSDDFSPYYNC